MLAPRSSNSSRTREAHYRELLWHTLGRQVLLYFLPLVLLALFFHTQYRRMVEKNRRAQLDVLAEHHANTLDLFLRERVINLENILGDLRLADPTAVEPLLHQSLLSLHKTSDAFVDLGVVEPDGQLVAYEGPIRFPGPVSYYDQTWFQTLLSGKRDWVITDIYQGFRHLPHFTIAVRYGSGPTLHILRAALSPEKIHEFLTSLEGAGGVHALVVNATGVLQVVTPRVGAPLEVSPYRPPATPRRGHVDGPDSAGASNYAYAWLTETPWALVVTDKAGATPGLPNALLLFTVVFFLLMGVVILVRARQLVGRQLAVERHEAELSGQLVQAAKLASVGELAAGIAHEINNPLAIIAEEVGLLKDSLDPELTSRDEEPLVLPNHLDIIHDAVFRCRDITRKLLTFVRHTEMQLATHHVHAILDELLDGILGHELQISDIRVDRDFDPAVREIVTDRNQLLQVFVNLVKNAVDAMGKAGVLTVSTAHRNDCVAVSVRDTGCGMTPDQLQRVFMPFFTTKDPGKGTGLGLSVSFSIIKSLGGQMYVDSAPGHGSVFTVELPYHAES